MHFLKRHSSLLVGGLLLGFLVLSLVLSYLESTTMDEKAHIPSGYSYVRYGDMRLNPEHPPLLKDMAGLPLLAFQPEFPLDSWEWREGINEQWVLGDKFINCVAPEEVCNSADEVTFWSRVPMILVALLLGFFVYRWTRELGGALAGLLAVFLYASDPNIIAHGHYVTTDIGIAAFLFFSFYYFVRFLKKPSGKNILLSGIWLGLAQLAKFSAVLLFPIFGLFLLLFALTLPRRKHLGWLRDKWQNLWSYSWKFAVCVVICFVLIWILYFFNTMNMPGEKLDIIAAAVFPDNGLGTMAENVVTLTSQNPVTKPLSEWLLGVFMVFARVAGGNTFYFLGTVDNHANPWYFPVVFMLKETLPFLFLLVATALYSLTRIVRAFRERKVSLLSFLAHSFQNKITQYVAVFFVLFYSYISITGNLNIGFRHLFPILPFLYMLIAKTVFDFIRRHAKDRVTRLLLQTILGLLVLGQLAAVVLTYPAYLSYFNAIGGGHENGYRFVTDSNYDWGQDVKRLRNFVETHNRCVAGIAMTQELDQCAATADYPPIDKIRVDYFGGSSPQYYLGDKFAPWTANYGKESGWYAISIGFLQESIHKTRTPGELVYDWLVGVEPVARAGDSFFIFYIP